MKRVALLLAVLASLSCNQVLDIGEPVTESTTPVEPPKTGPWRCVTGQNLVPPATIPPTINLTMTARYYSDFTTRAGITFQACAQANSIQGCTDVGKGTTDASGTTTFPVTTGPNGFVGHIRILDERSEEEKKKEPLVPFYYFFSNALFADLKVPDSVVVTQADVNGLAASAGADGTDAGLNHISATTVDCDGAPAANVSLKILLPNTTEPPPKSIPWYFRNGTASVTATATDASGLGGTLFLQAGLEYSVSSTNTEGTLVSQGGLVLAPGAFHTILMLPR
jgi:hypothetical protein